MSGIVIVLIAFVLPLIFKIVVNILSKSLNSSQDVSSNDNTKNKIEINYDYGHLFNTPYNYLCMDNILRIYDEGAVNKDYYLLGFIYGYLLSAKDVASQSYFMSGDEETAEKIARLSFKDLLKHIENYFNDTNKDELPIFEVIKIFIPTLQMPKEYDEKFRMLTIGMLCKNYVELENKFNFGVIDGYVLSVKEWMLLYMQLDEKSQIKIAKFDNIEDTKNYILSNNKLLKTMSNMVAHPIIMKAINDSL